MNEKLGILLVAILTMIFIVASSYLKGKYDTIGYCLAQEEKPSIELEIKKLELKKLQYEIKIINEQEELGHE